MGVQYDNIYKEFNAKYHNESLVSEAISTAYLALDTSRSEAEQAAYIRMYASRYIMHNIGGSKLETFTTSRIEGDRKIGHDESDDLIDSQCDILTIATAIEDSPTKSSIIDSYLNKAPNEYKDSIRTALEFILEGKIKDSISESVLCMTFFRKNINTSKEHVRNVLRMLRLGAFDATIPHNRCMPTSKSEVF